jgi:ABC-type sugar transport system substrate-binding protein
MAHGSTLRTKRMALATSAGALTLALAAGCSSSGPPAASGTSAASGSQAASTAIPQAVSALNQIVTRPTTIPVTVPITKPIPKGKTVDWLVCGVPECTVLTPPLQQAAAALGWHLHVIPAGLTPESVLAAWNLAAQEHPDAVIATGFPKVIFAKPLAKLAAAHIPVVDGFVTDSTGGGIIAMINGTTNFFTPVGKALADFVLGHEGTKANILFIGSTTFPGTAFTENEFKTEYTTVCSTCGFHSVNEPASSIGTTLNSDVVAYLTKNPSINYVVATQPSQLVGLPAALKTAGIHVGILTNSPNQTVNQYLAAGQIQGIMMSTQNDAMWQMMDALVRYFAGVSVAPSNAATPIWAVTQPTVSQLSYPYTLVTNYQQQYKTLWGIK